MTIHHMTLKAAQKLGITLDEAPPHVRGYHSHTKTVVYGVSGQDAIKQIEAVSDIRAMNENLRYVVDENVMIKGRLVDENGVYSINVGNPTELLRHLREGTFQLGAGKSAVTEIVVDEKSDAVQRNEAGVPLDGAIAYKEGIVSGDNPYEDGTDECEAWYEAWDKAADAQAEEDDGKPQQGGSVVANRYRERYRAAGHATHCGDWLAVTLNNYCVGEQATDLDTFEHICSLNGVDTSKYNRTTRGWQGRIRMTGRNLLARRVFEAGKIVLPLSKDDPKGGFVEVTPPEEWMAAQKYKRNEPAEAK